MKIRFSCRRCGRQDILAPVGTKIAFHSCRPPRGPRRTVRMPEVAVSREEMRSALFAALEAAVEQREAES
jgi:hypothetical protein